MSDPSNWMQEQRLNALYRINSLSHLSYQDQLREALRIGAQLLSMETGIISQIEETTYTVLYCYAPDDSLQEGQICDLGLTYCSLTMNADDLVYVGKMSQSAFQGHPCFKSTGLEAYIGLAIEVNGRRTGTLSFLHKQPRINPFTQSDADFLHLMARWIGTTLERIIEQQALRETQKRFEQISNHIDEIFAVIDPWERKVVYMGGAYEKITGYSPESVFISPGAYLDLIHPDDRKSVMEAMHARVEGNYDETYRIIRADGEVRWVRDKAFPVFGDNGQVEHVVGLVHDVTREKLAAQKLNQQQELLRRVVNRLPVVLYQIDENGTFMLSEGQGLEVIDLSPGQLVGLNAFDVYQVDAQTIDGLKRALQGEIVNKSYRIGNHVFDNVLMPQFADDGNVSTIIGIAVDVTERMAAEEERERLIIELEEALRFKDHLMATVSHELRTPLNAIHGYAELIALEEINEDIRHMVGRIDSNAERLLKLINDMLTMARMNADHVDLVQQPFDILNLVRHWYEDFHHQADEKSLDFILEYDDELPPILIGDADRLTQVISNLLHNAIKFTSEGAIRLTVEKADNYLQLKVTDTGIGIPAESQHLIFDEFRQLDSGPRRQYGGNGLGLSIVQRLLILMKGTITVDSQSGEGSTFTVRLPLIAAEIKGG